MYKVYIQYKTIKNERENSNVRLYKSVSLSAVRLFSRKAFFSRRLLTVRKIKKNFVVFGNRDYVQAEREASRHVSEKKNSPL